MWQACHIYLLLWSLLHAVKSVLSNSQHAVDLHNLLNNSLILETWDLNGIKGVMKRQNLKISRYHNPKNDWHTCYQAICQGNGCRIENDVVQFCYPAVIITGLPKCGTTAVYDLLARYADVVMMEEKENCPYARRRPHWQFFHSLPRYEMITEEKLIIDGCIQVQPNMVIRPYLHHPKTLYVVMTRNYADMLWSSYNFWCRWDVDGTSCDSSRWATIGLHERSNVLFHDIINADVNGTLHLKDEHHHSFIKNPTWVKRPCVFAGGYYSEFLTMELWKYIPRNETIVIASEELSSHPWSVWLKISSFFPHLNPASLSLGNFSQTRYNTQDASAAKGQQFLMTGIPIERYKPGVFAISGYQPLLNKTRMMLDVCWMDDCLLISQITGYLYEVCKEKSLHMLRAGRFPSMSEIYQDHSGRYRFPSDKDEKYPAWSLS